MVLPPLNQMKRSLQTGQRVLVKTDQHHVYDDSHLNPVLPVQKVLLLRVHQLKQLLSQEYDGRLDEQDPDYDLANITSIARK